MRLAGKVAVVTGVTSPLGQAIALRLAADGAAVAVTGNTPAKVEKVANDVETQYLRANVTDAQIAKRLERIPMGRLASPEDCAAAVASLVAPDMGYVTGQVLYVDGGFLSAGIIAR